jgi:hypothetical protein
LREVREAEAWLAGARHLVDVEMSRERFTAIWVPMTLPIDTLTSMETYKYN